MLIKKLTEIESPSGKEDRIAEFVKSYLENRGYEIVEGENYIATRSRSELIVATHLDTVSVKNKFRTDGVYAYGTGVCDAKASITAILEAADRDLDYTLAFFCDEEESGSGSKEFSEVWKHGKAAIVMEPTNLYIASRHYGSFDLTVYVKGQSSHGSMPEKGLNAIEMSCEMIAKVKKKVRATTMKIEGGSDEYVIPSQCIVKFDVVFEPGVRIEECIKQLEFLKGYGSFEVNDAYEGFESGNVANLLEEAMRRAGMNVVYTEMRSWTDALNLKSRFDTVVWGPGELHYCHTEKERVKIEDIAKARDVLINLNELC